MRALVLAVGNPSRGDDALGPALIERLEQRAGSLRGVELELLTDFQLQIEHALDVVGRDLVVFADAALTGAEPFAFESVHADPAPTVTTHAMTPGAVLHVYRQIRSEPPPDCRLLAIRGYHFELGEPMSSQAAANLDAALSFLMRWLDAPNG